MGVLGWGLSVGSLHSSISSSVGNWQQEVANPVEGSRVEKMMTELDEWTLVTMMECHHLSVWRAINGLPMERIGISQSQSSKWRYIAINNLNGWNMRMPDKMPCINWLTIFYKGIK